MLRAGIPILMMAAVLAQAQQDTPGAQAVGQLSIPAELTTTVRAGSAHRGDPVQFRTLEPVLVANGLVMPADAKLLGRVVGASPQQGDKPSWLVLLVERAEWKQQSILLHAFIARQIAISNTLGNYSQSADAMTNTSSSRSGRQSARAAVHDGIDSSPSTKMPQDARTAGGQDLAARSSLLTDLRIVRDKDGTAYLFSSKSNVKLPSGALFLLQNEAPAATAGSTGSASKTVPTAPKQ